MATLLEQGITAAKKGQKSEARSLFEQVLLADDRNERAWLWMSEVAETPEDRIACVEQVLSFNPGNTTAQLALKKLKETAGANTVAVTAVAPAKNGLNKSAARKPFKIDAPTTENGNGNGVHHQNTLAMPAASGDAFSGLRQASASTGGKNSAPSLDSIPLMPALVFGTLLLTAAGGLAMLALLLLLS